LTTAQWSTCELFTPPCSHEIVTFHVVPVGMPGNHSVLS
jgi:hypothetical protein